MRNKINTSNKHNKPFPSSFHQVLAPTVPLLLLIQEGHRQLDLVCCRLETPAKTTNRYSCNCLIINMKNINENYLQ
jgi:hypothetical protein